MYQYPGASKSVRITLSIISLFAVICYILYSKYGPTFKETFLKESASEAFYGKVDSIYNDVPNHDERIALLSNGYKLSLWSEWEPKITLGDSLSKKPNSLIIEVYENGIKKVDLSYIEIAKIFKKD